MTAVEIVSAGDLVVTPRDLSDDSLEDLAYIANIEHKEIERIVRGAVYAGVPHGIECGRALTEARSRLGPNAVWTNWLKENVTFSVEAARKYLRLAAYADLLEGRNLTFIEAEKLLRGLPAVTPSGQPSSVPDHVLSEARVLRDRGTSWDDIAERTGYSSNAIRRQLDPGFRAHTLAWEKKHRRKLQLARQALLKTEREAALKRAGGSASKAYGLLRQCLQELDQAAMDATGKDQREALRQAMAWAHKAEDAIIKTVKLSRRS